MDKLSYSEVMAILDGSKFPFISISRDGVFVDDGGHDESWPEYTIIREMEINHPQKDITKPLFTFPCTVQELRSLLRDYGAIDQLSGVIYLDKSRKYIASEIIDLMFRANLEENQLLPPEHEMMQFSIASKKNVLDNHEAQKVYYQERIISFLKRYSITCTKDDADEKLKTISVENIMSDVINWLQDERFAVFANDLATTTKTKPSVPKLQLEALSKLLKEIEQRAISKKIHFNRDEMFGIREQLHELAIIRFGNQLFAKSQHTFFDYLKNGEICKVKRGNRWSPIYSELFPEHPELKERKTRVKTKITQSPN
jgi:hypothetical protein